MGTRRRLATLVLLLIAVGALAAAAHAEVVQSGDVRVKFEAGFTPQALPREQPAPITVQVGGKISTTDGSHPPPLRRLRVELNSAGRIETDGLPVCAMPSLESTSSETALRRCRPALIGSGHFEAQLQFSGRPIRVDGQALAFNGLVRGHAGILIHIYIASPVRLTLVIATKISHQQGQFGTVLTTNVPKLAGGLGSITELQLRIGRRFRYHGRPLSYLSASCSAPAGFPGAVFTFARGTFSFAGGHDLRATLTRHCKVRRTG